MRPSSPVTNTRMSRIVKGRCDPLFPIQVHAQIAKSGGLRFHSELRKPAELLREGQALVSDVLSYRNEAS